MRATRATEVRARTGGTGSGMAELERKAGATAKLLKLIANERRLLILCRLAAEKEMAVSQLAAVADLSQSALSQHLARMRKEGLVVTRREGHTIFYRIADASTRRLLAALRSVFCP